MLRVGRSYRAQRGCVIPGRGSPAVAYAAWDNAALYLAVAVTKPDVYLRPAGSAPLKLDNEPDDIHSDGLQIYVGALAARRRARRTARLRRPSDI